MSWVISEVAGWNYKQLPETNKKANEIYTEKKSIGIYDNL